jgi:hypothetical protein
MSIEFATCEPLRALDYIKQVYPTKSGAITKDSIGKLLDLVGRDILRVQDPLMYGSRIAVVPGQKYSTEFKDLITEAFAQLKQITE